ncbi:SURF6-domain-containing protein [Lentithecium fluviatile CBS 122367]|uniref:SURF6-domain-containing protein n=1 Tax=Lentithecium fluviatile CBS 122367 TaxID=1168545 RepID=A0A6G1JC45_9PLEO|nr:SURF6-domain-containing protein [Lentithecium fluviatile CBS 122367]
MSLIPAKDYYGKDESITSTQWMKTKKQTREERQAAKRAKLDPANHKSAKDVMDENARKRKRELDGEGEDSSDLDMDIDQEKPGEGMKTASSKAKKQKIAKGTDDAQADRHAKSDADKAARAKAKVDRKQQKKDKKKEKQAQKQQNQEAKKTHQDEFAHDLTDSREPDEKEHADPEMELEDDEDRIQSLDVSGLVEDGQSTATPSAAESNASTASVMSSTSSSSSMLPPSEPQTQEKPPIQLDQEDRDAAKARLRERLMALRAARKADGPTGQPAKNRAELIEARRKKEAERKAAKKAQKQLVKETEERLKAEEQLSRLRGGSGSPSIISRRSTPDGERNLSFGRVAWNDGQQLDTNLSGFLASQKKKGKSDPKTALEAAKHKQARLDALDEEKRKDIVEKDLWLAAKKRAQGERVHDNPKLLQKSVKRLDKAKLKSEREWNERKDNVEKGKQVKQKRREGNLRKRREEKGNKGKKGSKPSKSGKKRAGFEGRTR